jgi:hypothetical protein
MNNIFNELEFKTPFQTAEISRWLFVWGCFVKYRTTKTVDG